MKIALEASRLRLYTNMARCPAHQQRPQLVRSRHRCQPQPKRLSKAYCTCARFAYGVLKSVVADTVNSTPHWHCSICMLSPQQYQDAAHAWLVKLCQGDPNAAAYKTAALSQHRGQSSDKQCVAASSISATRMFHTFHTLAVGHADPATSIAQ